MAIKKQTYDSKLIVEDYIEGYSGKNISKKYNISETTVYRILNIIQILLEDILMETVIFQHGLIVKNIF